MNLQMVGTLTAARTRRGSEHLINLGARID